MLDLIVRTIVYASLSFAVLTSAASAETVIWV